MSINERVAKSRKQALRRKGIKDGDLVVTLFGDVHTQECPSGQGASWEWAGRNNLAGDTACSECLPDGLPDGNPPHEFDVLEIERLKTLAGMGES